jgi:hypothetical protein
MKNRIRKFFEFFQAARTVDEAAHTNPIDARGATTAFESFREDGDRGQGWDGRSRPDSSG